MSTNSRDYAAEYRRRNRVKMREQHAAWRLANPEKLKAMQQRARAKIAADPVKAARVKALRHARWLKEKATRPTMKLVSVRLRTRGELVDYSAL